MSNLAGAKEDKLDEETDDKEGTIYFVLSLLSIISNVIECSKEVFHSVVWLALDV